MESSYDEDLDENVFFQTLRTDYAPLFEKAVVEGWVICVPRAGSMPKFALSYSEFFSHVLIPSFELPETHFRTLDDKDVRVSNRVISVESSELAVPFSVHILFEETYYTEDMLKYKVLCIETPMCQSPDCYKAESGIINVNSLRDCVDLLWTESSKEVLVNMDDHISLFLDSNNSLETEPLQSQKDLVGALYTQCLQAALRDARLREKTTVNRHLLDNVKVSVESYVLHGVYQKLIKGITRCTAAEDASFNKIVRNLADIQLRDLDINHEFQEVIPKARRELVKVEGYSTVLGKVGCIKRAISAISNLDSPNCKSNVVATDELIPLLVFLVLKSGLPNWLAHLTYIKEFSFSSNDSHSNQHSYLVTSLEAVIEHIRSGIVIGPSEPESQIDYNMEKDSDEDLINMKKNLGMTPLSKLFEMAKVGDHEQLEIVLNNNKNSLKFGSLDSLNLCHPLCSCDNCERKMSFYLCKMVPTVNSCDDRGLTVLHIAAIYGQPKVVDVILKYEADPNKSDYKGSTPLHYASARGNQNIVLLLLQSNAKIDQADNEGNIPLHLAANNGHETCVKALLCYAEYMNSPYNINFANNQGDTPLHNAARWGYEAIVFLLLDNGAEAAIENKRKLTPIDNAHNMDISSMLGISIMKKLNISSSNDKITKEVLVAAASKTDLDFVDNNVDNSNLKRQEYHGVIPKSTDEIKQVERALRAITFGDTRLACFYLGIESNSRNRAHKSCHPLCSCRSQASNDSPFGDGKVDQPLNINVCNSDGTTPLHVASFNGRNELVCLLIDAGAFINVQTRQMKLTPLHLACQKQHFPVVQSLLETNRCDIKLQDVQGNTALHYACQTSNLNIVKKLLEYGPNLSCRNNRNKTAMDEAKESVYISVINALLEHTTKT